MTARVVLCAPDSYKGTFTSLEVAEALAAGWRSIREEDTVLLAPLADGGEGTLVAIAAAAGATQWTWERAAVRDPLGRPVEARWLRSRDGTRAIIEMAEAAGLSRVAPSERDPVGATSAGLGDLLRTIAATGVHEAILGIGGSATTDGGRGMLEALGAHFEGTSANLDALEPGLGHLGLRVACDVTNPLLGPHGAAATYGPQKGATPTQVERLDERLALFADALEGATGRAVRDEPGAGAAGGVGFALLAIADRFRSFALLPGVELVMEATGFDTALGTADLVLTGEGRIDEQTGFGKTAAGVARRAREAGVRCVAVGGTVEPAGTEALAALGAGTIAVFPEPVTLDAARAAGVAPIAATGAALARSLRFEAP